MKKFILALLFIVSPLYAQFQSDNILTSPNAVWTDSRAYGSLSAAIAAIGANERTIVIAKQETVTNLTIPSNITLEFRKDGSIANSGTLTLQTKKIIAPDRQIFTGVGEIAFASGTIVRSSWFSNIESAIALTSTDTVTLVISKAQTLTASFAIGNNVQLKWESPGNILTANAGVTISNIRYVEAGDYQLFAGAGTFTFVDGINLNLRWFNSLRAALTWINITKANIRVPSAYVVDNNDTVPSNISLDFDHFNGSLSVSAGITLTLNCGIVSTFPSATIFTGLGTVTYSESTWLRANLASTASGKGADLVMNAMRRVATLSELRGLPSPSHARTVYLSGRLAAGDGGEGVFRWDSSDLSASVTADTLAGIYVPPDSDTTGASGAWVRQYEGVTRPQWWGAAGDGTTDNKAAFDAALTLSTGQVVEVVPGDYLVSDYLSIPSDTHLVLRRGAVLSRSSLGSGGAFVRIYDVHDVVIEGYGAEVKYGAKPDSGEHAHGVSVRGSSGITILGLASNDSGGDGFYIGASSTGGDLYSASVVIRDCKAGNNRRQGMSIVSVNGLVLDNFWATGTNGTAPQAGIDIETNGDTDKLSNIRITNPVLSENAGGGILIRLQYSTAGADPVDIVIQGAKSYNNSYGFDFSGSNDGHLGKIILRDSIAMNCTYSGFIHRNMSATGPVTIVDNVTAINCNTSREAGTASGNAAFYVRDENTNPRPLWGNLEIRNCRVIDTGTPAYVATAYALAKVTNDPRDIKVINSYSVGPSANYAAGVGDTATGIVYHNDLQSVVTIANDTTPPVNRGGLYLTANTNPIAIHRLDRGHAGQTVRIMIGDSNTTVDFTGTSLKGNGGVDWHPVSGDWMECVYDGVNWYCTVSSPTPSSYSGATASVADGGTITHGVGSTPTSVICTPSVASEMCSVTAIGATNFTVALKKHDGTAGTSQTIYWMALR
jgi:hypothetical protein